MDNQIEKLLDFGLKLLGNFAHGTVHLLHVVSWKLLAAQ
jgi:hypothetical protein